MLLARHWCQPLRAITKVLFITRKCTHTTGYHRLLSGCRKLPNCVIQRRVREKRRQILMRFCFVKLLSTTSNHFTLAQKSFFPSPFSEEWGLLVRFLSAWAWFNLLLPWDILSNGTSPGEDNKQKPNKKVISPHPIHGKGGDRLWASKGTAFSLVWKSWVFLWK